MNYLLCTQFDDFMRALGVGMVRRKLAGSGQSFLRREATSKNYLCFCRSSIYAQYMIDRSHGAYGSLNLLEPLVYLFFSFSVVPVNVIEIDDNDTYTIRLFLHWLWKNNSLHIKFSSKINRLYSYIDLILLSKQNDLYRISALVHFFI